VALAWAVTIILFLLTKYDELDLFSTIFSNFAIMLAFANVFFVELFCFSEGSHIWASAVFFSVLALYIFFRYENWLIRSMGAIIFLVIALEFYQAVLGFFVVFGLTMVLIKHKLIVSKESIKEWILIIGVGAISSVMVVVTMRVLTHLGIVPQLDRTEPITIKTFLKNLYSILIAQKNILVYGATYIKWGIGLVFLSTLVTLFACLKRFKYSWKTVILIILTIFANYAIVFAPQTIASTLWLAPRTICSYFANISALFLLVIAICSRRQSETNEINVLKYILAVVLGAFLIYNTYTIQNIGINQIASNRIDEQQAKQILTAIQKYEQESGIVVEAIYWHDDAAITYVHPEIDCAYMDINLRIGCVKWAIQDWLQVYSGRTINVHQMTDDKYVEIFQNKNWLVFDTTEQLKFEGNILYMVVY